MLSRSFTAAKITSFSVISYRNKEGILCGSPTFHVDLPSPAIPVDYIDMVVRFTTGVDGGIEIVKEIRKKFTVSEGGLIVKMKKSDLDSEMRRGVIYNVQLLLTARDVRGPEFSKHSEPIITECK